MAPGPDLDAVPKPITPGPQMQALARFHRAWTRSIEEGEVGPGTPAMTVTGRRKHHQIQEGNWIVGTYEQDQYLSMLEGPFPVLGLVGRTGELGWRA